MNEWDAYRAADVQRLAAVMAAPLLVDLRNDYSAAEAAMVTVGKSGDSGPFVEAGKLIDTLSEV